MQNLGSQFMPFMASVFLFFGIFSIRYPDTAYMASYTFDNIFHVKAYMASPFCTLFLILEAFPCHLFTLTMCHENHPEKQAYNQLYLVS